MRTSRRSSRPSTRSARSPDRAMSTSSVRCSGGITLSALLGHLAARRARKVHSATLAVCVLDMSAVRGTTAGLFVTPATIAAAKAASRKRGVVLGTDLARMFAWMRPNDLVWNYVVNNYLLGNEPPAHEILFWNNDSTRLPARLHADFLDLFEANPFSRPGGLRVRGRKIDLGEGRHRHLCHRRTYRPHHAVAGGLPHGAALRQRAQHVRPRPRRPRPESRQSAGEQAIVVRRGSGASGNARSMARAAREDGRLLVAALARVDPRALRARSGRRPRGSAASGIARSPLRPAPTCSSDDRDPAAPSTRSETRRHAHRVRADRRPPHSLRGSPRRSCAPAAADPQRTRRQHRACRAVRRRAERPHGRDIRRARRGRIADAAFAIPAGGHCASRCGIARSPRTCAKPTCSACRGAARSRSSSRSSIRRAVAGSCSPPRQPAH